MSYLIKYSILQKDKKKALSKAQNYSPILFFYFYTMKTYIKQDCIGFLHLIKAENHTKALLQYLTTSTPNTDIFSDYKSLQKRLIADETKTIQVIS